MDHKKLLQLVMGLDKLQLSLYMCEERYYPQKYKISWLKEGDENTSLFHRMLSAKERKCSMSELHSTGTSLLSFNEIGEEIISFLNSVYQNMSGNRYMPFNSVWNTVLGF